MAYTHTDEDKQKVVEVCLKHRYRTHSDNIYINWAIATKELNELFETNTDSEVWRGRYRKNRHRFDIEGGEVLEKSKVSRPWHEVTITCTEEEYGSLDDEMIISKMGFNPLKLKMKRLITNKWWTSNADGETLYHGQLKVELLPIDDTGIDPDWYIEHLKNVKPTFIETEYQDIKRLLWAQFNDMHFGINDFLYYLATVHKAQAVIESKHRDKIVFVIGGDTIHNNDLKGHTANLTQIEQVDMHKAIEDAIAFFTALISTALAHANEVILTYNRGNHDEMVSLMLVRELKALFPQCTTDISDEYYKLINYGKVAIGYTHGNLVRRSRKEYILHNGYMELFPDDFTINHDRYIFTEHYHRKELVDEWGTHVYTLGTKAQTDAWHKSNLYVGAKKGFKLYEFSEETQIHVYNV